MKLFNGNKMKQLMRNEKKKIKIGYIIIIIKELMITYIFKQTI